MFVQFASADPLRSTGRLTSPAMGSIAAWLVLGLGLGPSGGVSEVSWAVSCAGSTKRLTATNQEVAGSSPAGPATFPKKFRDSDDRPIVSRPYD